MNIYIISVIVIVLVIVIVIVSYKLGLSKGSVKGMVLEEKVNILESQIETVKKEYEGRLTAERTQFELRLDSEKKEYESRLQSERDTAKSMAEAQQKQFEQIIERQEESIKAQMKVASQEILNKQSEGLNSANKTQLSEIVDPLKEKIAKWEESISKVEGEYRERMSTLDATIKTTLDYTTRVGERADRLANALVSENKTQGNFGEMRLRTMLIEMGFEEGVQFKEQETLRDAQGFVVNADDSGKRLIPDVMLYFPDKRDIVIDSKISLTAFERYHNADTEEEKEVALRDHVKSVRSHVKELAHKDYSNYILTGHQKLDFVVMYMAVEGAMQLALATDPNLWKEAYDQGVFITGSQNLYALLRVLDLSWKQVQQVRNQKEIMDEANRIIDRTQLFYERMLNIEKQFNDVQKAFDQIKTVVAPEGPSIVTAARKLIAYGAKESPKKKSLPRIESIEEKEQAED